ncbi:MAG: hypothetical protein NTV86_10535, partial [Planctomycetota bacterium]|nr:hypothetical protein [Planctomycetota bacterium]
NSALGRRVQCPVCGEAFTAALPKAVMMEPPSPPELEPPPPGFAEHPGTRRPAPVHAPARGPTGDLIATPVDDDFEVIELAEIVEPPSPPARAPAGPSAGPSEIIDILQGRGSEDQGPMSDTLAALYGQAQGGQDDQDGDVQDAELVTEEVDEALSALAGASTRAQAAGRAPVDKANSWYIVSDAVEYGPYSGQAILAAVQSGRLRPHIVLHDAAAEVEVTVAQLVQAMVRQGRMKPPGGRTSPGAKKTPGTQRTAGTPKTPEPSGPPAPLAPDAPRVAETPAPSAPGDTEPPAPSPLPGVSHDPQEPLSALSPGVAGDGRSAVPSAALMAALTSPAPVPAVSPAPTLAQAAAAVPLRLARPRGSGLTLSETALLLLAAALGAAAAGLLLPWLAGARGARASLRLGDLANAWAHAHGGLTLGAAALALILLPLRRWSGRRLACACLVVLCLADLLVQGLALSDIRKTTGLAVNVGALGVGAWLALGGALAAGFLAAFAAATTIPPTRLRR